MKIASISENKKIEKRIAITPEIAKKYISLGFEISIIKTYAEHLGINDENYSKLGVKIHNNEKDVIADADIIVQLRLIDGDKKNILKENKIFSKYIVLFLLHLYLCKVQFFVKF